VALPPALRDHYHCNQQPADGLTDEERFLAAQAALTRTSLAPSEAGAAKKSKNVFAAFVESDSD
jgi:hypothetical protein